MDTRIRLFPDGNSAEIIRRRFTARGELVVKQFDKKNYSYKVTAKGLSPGDTYIVYLITYKNPSGFAAAELYSCKVKGDGMCFCTGKFIDKTLDSCLDVSHIKGAAMIKKTDLTLNTALAGFNGKWPDWRPIVKKYTRPLEEEKNTYLTGYEPQEELDSILSNAKELSAFEKRKKIDKAAVLDIETFEKIKQRLDERQSRLVQDRLENGKTVILGRVKTNKAVLYMLAVNVLFKYEEAKHYRNSGFRSFVSGDETSGEAVGIAGNPKPGTPGLWVCYI